MRRAITTLALAAAMMLLAIPTAMANSEHSNDTAGSGSEACRPGAQDNDLVGSWALTDKDDYIADVTAVLTARFGAGEFGDMGETEFQLLLETIPLRADETWNFCDKNRDGLLCVMTTEVSPYHWTLLDNRPFGT
jgi:hypothetical protein